MFSRIQNFISRHRRKFFGVAVTGAIIWGGWSYVNWRMQRSEEEYVREVLKKAKRHMHHKSSAQAAEKQVTALVPVAAKATNDALDTNGIVSQLKTGSKVSPKDGSVQYSKGDKETQLPLTAEERIAKWDELKRVSIARAVAYAYIPSILIVFIRLQLGVLGGYVFKCCGGDNIAAFLEGSDEKQSKEENQENMPFEIQEAYLSLTQFFLEGQSNSIEEKQVNPFHKSKDKFFVLGDPYWGNHMNNRAEGKSKLNLGQPLAGENSMDYRSQSFNDNGQKHNGLVTPSKLPMAVQHQKLNGNVKESDSLSEESSSDLEKPQLPEGSMSNKSESSEGYVESSSDKKLLVNYTSKFKVRNVDEEEAVECSLRKMVNSSPVTNSNMKGINMVNGVSNSFDSIDSSAQTRDIPPHSISAEESDGLKDTSSRETAEEDSGRCSGTDDISEDEVVEATRTKSGIEVLCSLLEKKVGAVVDNISLKTPLTLAETETLFWGILTSIRSNPAEDPAFNLPKYLLPSPEKIKETVQDIESHLSKKAATIFNEMVSETSDLLETKEVVELVQSCVSAGLGHIMDRLANHFPADLHFDIPLNASTNVKREFQEEPTIPLAKLIPIVSKVAFEEGTPWVRQLLEMGNLKDFGANVYEAFTR
ncbi:uncharacterized protein Pex3 [Hetaerina americana]|uniref:uncharacterized protein Pex3 n=1 Tax=Hetaerina americana TaxID=62018 RepID=UPI003A7F3E93